MIYGLIAILFPSVLGVKILDYLNKGLSLKNTVYYYFILVMLSNFFNNIFSYLFFKVNENIFYALCEYPIFFSKFVLVSIAINILLVLLIIILQKNIKIDVVTVPIGSKNAKRKTNKKKNF